MKYQDKQDRFTEEDGLINIYYKVDDCTIHLVNFEEHHTLQFKYKGENKEHNLAVTTLWLQEECKNKGFAFAYSIMYALAGEESVINFTGQHKPRWYDGLSWADWCNNIRRK